MSLNEYDSLNKYRYRILLVLLTTKCIKEICGASKETVYIKYKTFMFPNVYLARYTLK